MPSVLLRADKGAADTPSNITTLLHFRGPTQEHTTYVADLYIHNQEARASRVAAVREICNCSVAATPDLPSD